MFNFVSSQPWKGGNLRVFKVKLRFFRKAYVEIASACS